MNPSEQKWTQVTQSEPWWTLVTPSYPSQPHSSIMNHSEAYKYKSTKVHMNTITKYRSWCDGSCDRSWGKSSFLKGFILNHHKHWFYHHSLRIHGVKGWGDPLQTTLEAPLISWVNSALLYQSVHITLRDKEPLAWIPQIRCAALQVVVCRGSSQKPSVCRAAPGFAGFW